MNQIVEKRKRRSWRRRTYVWTFSLLAFVSALIYWEQTALLYVISTVLMCGLLLVVAFADLKEVDSKFDQQAAGAPTERNSGTGRASTGPQTIKREDTAA